MKKILENPKVIVYENVEKLRKLFEDYYEDEYDENFLIKILNEFDIPLGKKTVIELFENNVQAILEDGKITLQLTR
jgi:hypothetical protein